MFPAADDPFDMVEAAVSLALVAMEAQLVISMRLMGMVGLWNVPASENLRMINEKTSAMVAAQSGVMRAVLQGEGPGAAVLAAVKPVRRRTRSNVKRLMRRGPTLG